MLINNSQVRGGDILHLVCFCLHTEMRNVSCPALEVLFICNSV